MMVTEDSVLLLVNYLSTSTETSNEKTKSISKGPQSSVAEYTPTVDIGKQAPAGNSDDGYRRLGSAAGNLFY